MKLAYPIVLTPAAAEEGGGYTVKVPDLDIFTQGDNIPEALYMARDAIGMWVCYEQDKGRDIPEASNIAIIENKPGEIKSLVDIDVDQYRQAHDNRTIRKNLTIPSWLNDRAEKAGINFSHTLQNALKNQLNIPDPIRKQQ
jgi:predicted RNase H-like HicB family nuclease